MSEKLTLDLNYFEDIIIFKLLSDTQYSNLIIDKLNSDYFNNKDNKNIFKLIHQFYLEKNKIPTIGDIKQYLSTNELQKSFLSIIKNIKNIDKNIDENELVTNSEKFIKERGIFDIIWNVAKNENINPHEVSQKIQDICNITIVNDIGLDLFSSVDKFIEFHTTPNRFIKTGWTWLDDALGGGLYKNGNQLVTFYGRPNIGKSIVLGNITDNIAKQGFNTLLITLEMNEMSYAKRLFSKITHIPINEMLNDIDEFRSKVDQNKKGNIFIKEFPTASITPQFIRGYVEQLLKSGVKIDALVIDYIDLIMWSSNDSEHLKKKKIAEHLRGTSKILKIPITTVDQLNRSGYNEENPDMSHAAGSTGVNVTGDVIVGLIRNDDDIELGVMKMKMLKNRDGPVNIPIKVLKIDFNTLTIFEDEILDQIEEHEETYDMFANLNIE